VRRGPAAFLHWALRRLLPRAFRERHGADMEAAFLSALEGERRRGGWRAAALLAREAADLLATGARLRARTRRESATQGGREMRHGSGIVAAARDDLRQAVRTLARKPAFTLFAAGTVALGTGATTAIFSALESVVLNPLPYEGADRIVSLWRSLGAGHSMLVSPDEEQVDAWASQADLFETVVRVHSSYPNLTEPGEAARVQVALVEPSFFDFLGVQPVLGRSFAVGELVGDGAPVAMLSHHVWTERFGADPSALGRTVTLNGERLTVVGVLPPRMPMPTGIDRVIDVFRPLPASRSVAGATVLARLREGVTVADVQSRMDLLARRAGTEGEPSSAWQGTARRTVDLIGLPVKDNLRVLMTAAALLLLIACVNVSNLLLARATRREQETAVRSALGASRGRIVREQFLESLLLGLLGGGGGVGLAWLAVRGMAYLRGDTLAVLGIVHLNAAVLAFTVGISLLAVLVFGGLPAIRTGWRPPAPGLTGTRGSRGGRRESRARWFLLTAEVALSFALLVGAGLVLRSLVDLRSRDPGFRADGLVALRLSLPVWKYEGEGWTELYDRIRGSIARLPEVTGTVQASGVPPEGDIFFGALEVQGRGEIEGKPLFYGLSTEPGYFALTGQRILEGRDFTAEEHRDGAPVVILGEGAARTLFPDGDAVGGPIRQGGEWRTVVGVTRDVAIRGLSGTGGELQQYRPLDFQGGWIVARVTGPAEDALAAIRREVVRTEPDAAILELAPVAGMLQATLGRERFTSGLLAAFAALALALSAVGLYGVVSQLVGQRTREIGIRMSMGARASSVRAMVLRQGLAAVAVGVVAGVGLAAGGLGLLRSRVFGVAAAGPGAFAAAAVVMCAVALAACWIPACRAASVDPCEALRAE